MDQKKYTIIDNIRLFSFGISYLPSLGFHPLKNEKETKKKKKKKISK
jgi:hypothetical protein